MTEQNEDIASTVEDYASSYAEFVARHAPFAIDHRAMKPCPYVTPIRMQRLDANLSPLDESFDAATRDLSLWGLGITVEPETPEGNYAIRFTLNNKDHRLVAKLLWTRPIEGEPFPHAGLHVRDLAVKHEETS